MTQICGVICGVTTTKHYRGFGGDGRYRTANRSACVTLFENGVEIQEIYTPVGSTGASVEGRTDVPKDEAFSSQMEWDTDFR